MPSMSMYATFFLTLVYAAGIQSVLAEKHTITFDNQCGHGTPQLVQRGNILSTGKPFTSNGPFVSAIAYLQTGKCLLNGEGCSLVEMTLVNPTCSGCGSSTDISLIPPLAFSVPVSFSYSGGCNGQGATCTSATCNTAFFVPDDNQVQVACQDKDVDLVITFCPGSAGGDSPPKVSSSAVKPISTKAAIPATTSAAQFAAASPSTKAPQTASVNVTSASPTPIPVPVPNAPICSSKRSARRRRSVSATEEETRSPRMVHAHAHNARKDF